jgi:outer membrane receptor protein involved in Fe transport
VNGRRLPSGSPGAGGSAPDVNQIPANLIERIEVLTGGASATYGSDAVAGVVNFILKDDFEGFSFDYQHSFYQHENNNSAIQDVVTSNGFDVPTGTAKDGHTNDFSMIFGANTADDRGNVTMYATFRDIKPVLQADRDYSACALNGTSSSFGCGGSSTTPAGRFTNFSTINLQVAGNEFVPFRDLYNYGPLNYYQRPNERKTLGALGRYEINDNAELYAEVSYMDDRTVAQIAPSGAFFVTDKLFCGNPLLSTQQFDAICGSQGLGPDEFNEGFYVGRRNVEGGPRQSDLRHTSMRAVLGVKGFINDDWSYDIFANHGTVAYVNTYRNEMSIQNIVRALDVRADPVTGEAVCQSVLDGSDSNCVPWNVFSEGGVTQDSLDYLIKPLYARGDTYSTQVTGFVAGDLTSAGITVPGTSTGAGVVLGFEYRRDALNFEPDFGFRSGDGAGQGGPTNAVSGNFNVQEIFGELNIPLLEGRSYADDLTLELAYRHSEYSTDQSTDTYKYAANWRLNDALRFRASFQRAVRAGNVRDLFRPQGIGLFNMSIDPCGIGGSLTLAQCENTGITPDQYRTSALESPAGQYNFIGGGNPDLAPEKSDTVSFGFAYSPEFVEGLSINVDYFDIDIEDAISNIPPLTILNECGTTGQAIFCDLIDRGSNGNLWVGDAAVTATDINIGYLATSGVDIEMTYSLEMGDMGDVNLGFVATWLDSLENQPLPGATIDDCVGQWDRSVCGQPTPEWRHNLRATWVMPWDVTVTTTWRYLGEAEEYNGLDEASGPDNLGAQSYFDIATTYVAHENVTLRAGISNLFDKEPPLIPNSPTGSGNGNTFPGFYDGLGRYIFAGFTLNF